MLLIFGLGNPGREYENTYHNVGVLALGRLSEALDRDLPDPAPMTRQKHFWYKKYNDVILAGTDPQGDLYMNQSGIAVREVLDFFKLPPANLVILHDDSDLPLGEWKLEPSRGAAGHHGVESVIDTLGTNEFTRGRIGIRPPEPEGRPARPGRRKAEEFVLDQINEEGSELLKKVFQGLAVKVMEKA